jgi:predicted nucleic acid-binding protein
MTDPNTPWLGRVLRSNLLPALVDLARAITASDHTLLDIEVFSMVLDANKVIAEIRWRLGKRIKPYALTGIFESIEARVLIAYVPSYTEHEIFENAEKVALEIGKSKDEVLEEWRRIKPFLRVHETAMQQVEVIELADPKDLVYMATQQQLGLSAIYSADPHLQRMGAPLVKGRIDDDLRDYARGSAVTIGVSFGSGLVVSIAIPTVFRILKSASVWLLRQPVPIQLALAALVFTLLRNPRVRSWVADRWQQNWPPLLELMTPILLEYCEAQTKTAEARNRIQQAIPAPAKRCSALKYCQGACPAGNRPRSLGEILRRMRDAGYRSTSKDPASYVRSVMRRSDMFVELPDDRWVQRSPTDRFDHLREDSYMIRPVSQVKPKLAHPTT